MTANELFEIMVEHFDYNKKEIITNINELLFNIHEDSKKFEYTLDKLKEDYALEDEPRCPLCGENLTVINEWDEDRGEYQGFPANEHMVLVGCENCSYILNE